MYESVCMCVKHIQNFEQGFFKLIMLDKCISKSKFQKIQLNLKLCTDV